MPMICTQCRRGFEQALRCPQCGNPLRYQPERRRDYLSDAPAEGQESWQQTPWGRLVAGLLVAQGLYYVLRHLTTAGMLALGGEMSGGVWATLGGLVVLQVLAVTSVLIAGLITGAGRSRGYFYGAIVGVWNGLLFLAAQHWSGRPVTIISLVGEPILQVAFGALGGLLGSLVWRPVPSLNLPAARPLPLPSLPPLPRLPSFGGPIAWGRVLAGATLAVFGVIWTDVIREFVLDASEGRLRIDTHLQANLVTWEISALAMLAGSALAGASTFNGLKQGLCVGIGTATVLLGIQMANKHLATESWLLMVSSALCLGLAGGWFGSQLLPPVYNRRRHRSLGPVTD